MWEPLWAAAEAHNTVLAFHIGTGGENVVYRGPGGAVVNYMETTYPGMRVVSHMVAGGALDRHPELKVMIAEGGAAWVPAIGDRMDEAYRQHGMFVRPKLSRLPSEIIRSQVYASFQHDRSAVEVIEGTGYTNVMWGDDYPHLEGTYGHTQETLHGLFAHVSAGDQAAGAARHFRGALRRLADPGGQGHLNVSLQPSPALETVAKSGDQRVHAEVEEVATSSGPEAGSPTWHTVSSASCSTRGGWSGDELVAAEEVGVHGGVGHQDVGVVEPGIHQDVHRRVQDRGDPCSASGRAGSRRCRDGHAAARRCC